MRGTEPVVLKVIRKEHSEEWRCGEILDAFAGGATIRPIAYTAGAVLLPRLQPGHDLVALARHGRDDEATEIIASLIQQTKSAGLGPPGTGSVDRLRGDFARFRHGGDGIIPLDYVDRAEALFDDLCATQSNPRLLHGDLHHYNVLFDEDLGWVVIDPWGVVGESEFELGPSLRNPIDAPELLQDPRNIERRLRVHVERLALNADRALKWAFATTVLAILWPVEDGFDPGLARPFAAAAHSMRQLLE